jgi:hypothetical protein
MNAIKILFTIFIFSVFFTSCEKDVVLDLAQKKGNFMVVDANLTNNGKNQWIRLSWSSSYYDVSIGEPVSNAVVKVNTEGQSFEFYESPVDSLKGYYINGQISSLLAEKEYFLTIEHDGNTYTAQSELKPLPVLDSLTLEISFVTQLGFIPDTIYDIYVHFEELPSPDDYYLFDLYVNDTIKTPRPSDKSLVSDINLEPYVSFSVLNINKADLKEGDKIRVEMRSISSENWNFYNIFFFQTDLSGNPFAGAPPANIPTNMSEGAKGFFQVSKLSKLEMTYLPETE